MTDKQCFVITPYDTKEISAGVEVDFEYVFREIVQESVRQIKSPRLLVQRSRDEAVPGSIADSVIRSIFDSDVAIVDVSGNNPNVYYELGLRHALKRRTTILICFKTTKLPFDIAGMRVVHYDHTSDEGRKKAIREISYHLQAALAGAEEDSPVFKALSGLKVTMPEQFCSECKTFEYRVSGAGDRRIGIKTGAITEIKGVDVWVNSENTDMEMARPYEKSVSSIIRYFGSKRNIAGRIEKDLIQDALRAALGDVRSVAPATVIVTDPGELRSRGVKALFHVASVQGEPGHGYQPIQKLGRCVTHCLEKLLEMNSLGQAGELQSILFPLFGTGQGGKNPGDVLHELVTAAHQFVVTNAALAPSRIYFLAYTRPQLEMCRHVFARIKGLFEVADLQQILDTMRSLKLEAMRRRREGDLDDAIDRLRKSAQLGSETLAVAPEGGDRRNLARELADCLGMLGGNLLRKGELAEAIQVFAKGRAIEMDDACKLDLTYNTVNLMVARVLDAGPDAIAEFQADLKNVIERLKRRAADPDELDLWLWADLGMCEFLAGNFDAARVAYKRAAALGTEESRRSILERLASVKKKFVPPAPELDAAFRAIHAALS